MQRRIPIIRPLRRYRAIDIPHIETRFPDDHYLISGAVLATRNEEVGEINDAITDRSPGDAYELKSEDSVARDEDAGLYPAEFSNSIEVSGIPPHQLRLKVGMTVMMLRNLNAASGMRNGSKAIVRTIRPRSFEVEIFNGGKSGQREFTPDSLCRLPTLVSHLL